MEDKMEIAINKEFIKKEPTYISAIREVGDHNYCKTFEVAVKQEVIKLEEPEIQIKVEAVDIELDPLGSTNITSEYHINTVLNHEQNKKSNTLHKCTHCKYATNNRHKFTSHMWQHKPYVGCTYCVFTTKSAKKLQDHLQLFHYEEKLFKCIADVYRTKDGSIRTIPKHVLAPQGKKPFKCDYCNYESAQESHLQQHIRVHVDINSLKCADCDYRTTRKRDMTFHMKIHVSWDNNKKQINKCKNKYKCKICDFITGRRNIFHSHMAIHYIKKEKEPFRCEICNFKTTTKRDFIRHKDVHTGDKHFQCTVCDYKTAYMDDLQKHRNIHGENQLNKCTDGDDDLSKQSRKLFLNRDLV